MLVTSQFVWNMCHLRGVGGQANGADSAPSSSPLGYPQGHRRPQGLSPSSLLLSSPAVTMAAQLPSHQLNKLMRALLAGKASTASAALRDSTESLLLGQRHTRIYSAAFGRGRCLQNHQSSCSLQPSSWPSLLIFCPRLLF